MAVRCVEEEKDEGDGDWLHARWRWVAFVEEFVHSAKAEVHCTIESCQPGVRGPQNGERLTNRAEDVTNVLSCDDVAAGGNFSISISLGKDLEVGDRILNVCQERVQVALGTKLEPDDPMGILALGVVRIDCKSHGVRRKAEISAEFICDERWHICQGLVWG